jgi:5-oxoprolinase (ATP-hydrolysing) subunit A
MTIDLNADLGEGLSTDAELMPFISSANIACGYHAGDRDTMRKTVDLCLEHGVAIGAHPSFDDRPNFGRTEIQLSSDKIKELIMRQIYLLHKVCNEAGVILGHIKPHGALYNMSAREVSIARVIAETVFAFNPNLKLFGLSGSHSIAEGVMAGLTTVAEVFADRTYQPDGSLTPRSQPHALITDPEQALEQAVMLAMENRVMATNGEYIPVQAETICLHGDGPHAVSFARIIHQTFCERGINIRSV